MASKNSIKSDIKDGFYHIYNRGVGKMDIFKDEMDFGVFLSYLSDCLLPPPNKEELYHSINIQDRVLYVPKRIPKNYYGKIALACYCLMPNHFHFLIKQLEKGAMKNFIHSVLLRYSMYFNKKYDRVGPLFQGRYKAIFVDNESYLLYLSKYIHLNPSEFTHDLLKAKSSYADFVGLKNTLWVCKNEILKYFNNKVLLDFKKVNKYEDFVEKDKDNISIINELTLED